MFPSDDAMTKLGDALKAQLYNPELSMNLQQEYLSEIAELRLMLGSECVGWAFLRLSITCFFLVFFS